MGVDIHSYGWLDGSSDGGVNRTKPGGVGCMSGDARALPECKLKTLIAPDRTAFQVRSSG